MTSTLKTNAIEPEGATTNLAIGKSGQDIIVTGNDIRANVLQDAGGNAIFTSNGSGTLSGLNSGFGSAKALISTQTASDDASISFTSGLSSSYEHYLFEFRYLLPATDYVDFTFQVSTNAGVAYGIEITSSVFHVEHKEDGSHTELGWRPVPPSLADSTSYQVIFVESPNSTPSTFDGSLNLFNPASTIYKKNWYLTLLGRNKSNTAIAEGWYVGGYVDTTDEVDAINFKFTSGNIASGQIRLYGVK